MRMHRPHPRAATTCMLRGAINLYGCLSGALLDDEGAAMRLDIIELRR